MAWRCSVAQCNVARHCAATSAPLQRCAVALCAPAPLCHCIVRRCAITLCAPAPLLISVSPLRRCVIGTLHRAPVHRHVARPLAVRQFFIDTGASLPPGIEILFKKLFCTYPTNDLERSFKVKVQGHRRTFPWITWNTDATTNSFLTF